MKISLRKKVIAFTLCMVMVLSSGTSALADETVADASVTNKVENGQEVQSEETANIVETEAIEGEAVTEPVVTEPTVTEPIVTEPTITEPESTPESTPAEQPEEKPEEKPEEIVIETVIDGTTITMSGPKTSFPEGGLYEILVSKLDKEKTQDVEIALRKKELQTNTSITSYQAYDIKLMVDGTEAQPTGEVNVKFSGTDIEEQVVGEESVEVFHVDEEKQVANEVAGETEANAVEMTTNHFSTYVITTKNPDGVTVTVQHYLESTEKPLYRDTTEKLTVNKQITDVAVATNYKALKVVKIESGKEGEEITGDQLIVKDTTYRVYYEPTSESTTGDVQMFDYQVKGTESINDPRNYPSDSGENTRLASGVRTKSPYEYSTAIKYGSSSVFINDWDRNYIEGVVFGSKYAMPDIITGIDNSTGALIMGTNTGGKQLTEPGFFTKEQKLGKQILNDYKLEFKREGDTYTLDDVKKNGETTLSNYGRNGNNIGADFFPLDSIKGNKYDAANDSNHNDYFGLRYDIEFSIGDYLGDLNYSFKGDDDLWVVLDAEDGGGEVIVDLGGIHAALSAEVDIWEALFGADKDRSSLTEEERAKKHTLTVLYMERGATASNCYMNFTLPNSKIIEVEKVLPSFSFLKTDSGDTGLAGAEFTLYDETGTQYMAVSESDSDGSVTFKELEPGNYQIKETRAPEGYVKSAETWNLVVEADGAQMYSSSDANYENPVTVVKNYTEYEESIKNMSYDKTAKVIDEANRIFQINLSAGVTGQSEGEAAKGASIVLVLDASASMEQNGRELQDIKDAANSFINTTKEKSPISEVAVIWYSGTEGNRDETVKSSEFYTLDKSSNIKTLKSSINAGDADGGTPMGVALAAANERLNSAQYSNKYVLFFTDGMPGYNSEKPWLNCMVANRATSEAEKIKENAIIYTIGYMLKGSFSWKEGHSSTSTASNNHKDYEHTTTTSASDFLSQYIATKQNGTKEYAFTTENSGGLNDIFEDIAGQVGEFYSVEAKNVVDVIDSRFELTADSKQKLVQEYGSDIKIVENADGTTTLTWSGKASYIKNVKDGGWSAEFQIQAKDDFVGGNMIPTNDDSSGITVDDSRFNQFPQPSVNVKLLTPEIGNDEITLYKGDTIESSKFPGELLKTFAVLELDKKTKLEPGKSGIPSLTAEEIVKLNSGEIVTKDYAYPGTSDVVGTFIFSYKPSDTPGGNVKDHIAEKVGSRVEVYELSVQYTAQSVSDRAGRLTAVKAPDTNGGTPVTGQNVKGEYVVNVNARWGIVKRSASKEDLYLKDAKFELQPKNNTSQQLYYGISNENGEVEWYKESSYINKVASENLATGSYTLKETEAPTGYMLSDKVWNVEITDKGLKSITSSTGDSIQPKEIDGVTTYYFDNEVVYELPDSGGTGIYWYMVGGMLLMFAAALILYKRRCKEMLKN